MPSSTSVIRDLIIELTRPEFTSRTPLLVLADGVEVFLRQIAKNKGGQYVITRT
jgi:hypothetical protein